jgi:hypothetical protein
VRFVRFRPARVTVESVRRTVLVVGGLIGALALAGCAAQAGTGNARTCAAYAYRAIERHQAVTGMPAACAGLGRAEVNQAASTAIRQASGGGPKSAWRKQAGLAAPWVTELLTGQVPAPASGHPAGAGSPAGSGGSLLGGASELSVKVSALLAWLATAASGGYILVRWLLAGGSLRRRNPTAAPPAVIAAHAGSGVFGLVLWTAFMATGVTALAWISVGIMAPVAGLGMGVLMLGLPAPRPAASVAAAPVPAPGGAGAATATPGAATATLTAPAAAIRPRSRIPVLAIAAHGVFATTALLLVLLATVGAG